MRTPGRSISMTVSEILRLRRGNLAHLARCVVAATLLLGCDTGIKPGLGVVVTLEGNRLPGGRPGTHVLHARRGLQTDSVQNTFE